MSTQCQRTLYVTATVLSASHHHRARQLFVRLSAAVTWVMNVTWKLWLVITGCRTAARQSSTATVESLFHSACLRQITRQSDAPDSFTFKFVYIWCHVCIFSLMKLLAWLIFAELTHWQVVVGTRFVVQLTYTWIVLYRGILYMYTLSFVVDTKVRFVESWAFVWFILNSSMYSQLGFVAFRYLIIHGPTLLCCIIACQHTIKLLLWHVAQRLVIIIIIIIIFHRW